VRIGQIQLFNFVPVQIPGCTRSCATGLANARGKHTYTHSFCADLKVLGGIPPIVDRLGPAEDASIRAHAAYVLGTAHIPFIIGIYKE
jgi:hypothetical protein